MAQKVDWKDFSTLENVATQLKKGKIVAGSSDTILGLFSTATAEGKKKLDSIKQRHNMPYLLLVANELEARKLSSFFKTDKGATLVDTFWPGPVTLIVPACKGLPDYLQSPAGGIAIRVPDHVGLQWLLSKTGMLFSTSANLSGEPVPQNLSDLDPAIVDQVSFLIQDENEKEAVASTILDCMQEPIRIIREGSLSKKRLEPFL